MLFRRSTVASWRGLQPCRRRRTAPRRRGGKPGDPAKVTRVIDVVAIENAFSLKSLDVRDGETVRFVVRNDGMEPHELTIGTVADMASIASR